MLSYEVVNQVMPLAEMLAARKVSLEAIAGTPLAEMVYATNTLGDPTAAQIVEATNISDPNVAINYHDNAVDSIAAVAIPAVRDHVRVARSIVAPLVEDLATRVQRRLSELNPLSITGAEVTLADRPGALTNSALVDMLEKFGQSPFSDPGLRVNLPDLSIDEIKEHLKTGVSSLDKEIELWLAEESTDWLLDLWQNVFQIKDRSQVPQRFTSFAAWIADRECGDSYALAIFLLARNLFDNVPEGTAMNLTAYRNHLSDYRDQAAAALVRRAEMYERDKKAGRLIIEQDGLKIKVNPDVYPAWLEAGGCNEVLFGAALDRRAIFMADAINIEAEKFKAAWARYCDLATIAEKNKRLLRTKEILIAEFNAQLQETLQDEAGTDETNAAQIYDKFKELVAGLYERDLGCLYSLSLKLICESRFPNAGAYDILQNIDATMKSNPSLAPREAATLAVLEYVCDWIASQVRVVPL